MRQLATAQPPDVADLVARIERLEAIVRLVEPIIGDHADRWLTVRETSVRLGMPATTLRGWIAAGRVPAQRVRGVWEIAPEWVAAKVLEKETTCPQPVH